MATATISQAAVNEEAGRIGYQSKQYAMLACLVLSHPEGSTIAALTPELPKHLPLQANGRPAVAAYFPGCGMYPNQCPLALKDEMRRFIDRVQRPSNLSGRQTYHYSLNSNGIVLACELFYNKFYPVPGHNFPVIEPTCGVPLQEFFDAVQPPKVVDLTMDSESEIDTDDDIEFVL